LSVIAQDQVIADGIAEYRNGLVRFDLIDDNLLPRLGNPCFSQLDAWHGCPSSCIAGFMSTI
jgi:hypothetical protein